MAKVIDFRMTAEMDGEFVVFLIGARIGQTLEVVQMAPRFLRDAENVERDGKSA